MARSSVLKGMWLLIVLEGLRWPLFGLTMTACYTTEVTQRLEASRLCRNNTQDVVVTMPRRRWVAKMGARKLFSRFLEGMKAVSTTSPCQVDEMRLWEWSGRGTDSRNATSVSKLDVSPWTGWSKKERTVSGQTVL